MLGLELELESLLLDGNNDGNVGALAEIPREIQPGRIGALRKDPLDQEFRFRPRQSEIDPK